MRTEVGGKVKMQELVCRIPKSGEEGLPRAKTSSPPLGTITPQMSTYEPYVEWAVTLSCATSVEDVLAASLEGVRV